MRSFLAASLRNHPVLDPFCSDKQFLGDGKVLIGHRFGLYEDIDDRRDDGPLPHIRRRHDRIIRTGKIATEPLLGG